MPPLHLRADWRRTSYLVPLAICTALVGVAAVLACVHLARPDLVGNHPVGPAPAALLAILFLTLLELPRRRLDADDAGVVLSSWLGKRRIAWSEVAEVAPGSGGWLAVNRQLPAAAVLVLRGGGQVRVFDVWPMPRTDLVQALRTFRVKAL